MPHLAHLSVMLSEPQSHEQRVRRLGCHPKRACMSRKACPNRIMYTLILASSTFAEVQRRSKKLLVHALLRHDEWEKHCLIKMLKKNARRRVFFEHFDFFLFSCRPDNRTHVIYQHADFALDCLHKCRRSSAARAKMPTQKAGQPEQTLFRQFGPQCL